MKIWIMFRRLVLVYMYACVFSTQAFSVDDATNLQTDLLQNYSKNVRPTNKPSVSLYLGLMHITDLDIVTQTLRCVGFLRVMWDDSRLQWNPVHYGAITSEFFRFSDVWSPPILLSNAAEEIKFMNDNSDIGSILVKVLMNGGVIWLVPANFVAQCSINIKYYPFDTQTCDFLVSSWTLSSTQLFLYATDPEVNTDLYVENGEWELTGSSVTNTSRTLVSVELPSVRFTIHLKRKYSYYLMNMVLPVIFLALLGPCVFLLPVECGEKNGFSLTILLSMSVVMTIVSDNIPPTSTHVCVLSVYLLLTFILCTLETFLTVVVCKLHDNGNQGYKMGRGTQRVCRVLAKLTRSRRPSDDDSDDVTARRVWNETEPRVEVETKKEAPIEYTYTELSMMFDRFNLFFFFFLTIVVTVVFMVVLETAAFS